MHRIPNYTLDDPTRQGSAGALHRGRRVDDGTPVIIKTIEGGAGRSIAYARLHHEFHLLRRLDVPGVPRALALETYPGGRALVLEAVAGEPLAAVLARGRLAVREALGVGVALAGVLAELHRRGLIVKRLTPQSVFCELVGPTVSLVDLGAASPLAQEPGRTTPTTTDVAELTYISPEQTGRMNRAVDTRADLYALGVILHEALAGAPPFAPMVEPLALIHAHVARRPAPLDAVADGVPGMVARIVARLLAKTAEERYQTADGVRRDLLRCLAAIERGEQVASFTLGAYDQDGTLRIPQRLYGREAEVAALMAAFDRVHAGSTEALLVSGYSGVGKSALVREVNQPIAARGGVFVAGKFDQFDRSAPYAALGQALRELARLLLCESPAALAGWQTRIQEALGASGALLLGLVPELERIVGPQPALPSLAPGEAQHRLGATLRRFVRAIASPSHPLVIFLDDLQWIDAASLHLVGALLADEHSRHLLVVGAYRDHEVDATHLLAAALETLRRSGARLTELSLQPLAAASVVALLAEALDLPAAAVEPLAAALIDKTQGNPFFLGQYLDELCAERLLRFDEQARRWVWDLPAIAGRVVADNVVALVTARLLRLPPETRAVVTLAAAIGHQFDAATLATIHGSTPPEAVCALWPALVDTVVVPVGEDYRLLADVESAGALADGAVWFRFIHDRLQQAAYALTPADGRPALHREIGRLLVARHGDLDALPPAEVFEVARHLGLGAAVIVDPRERVALAELDLLAGRRARAAAAYEAAAAFLAAGVALLDASHWDSHRDLAYALHRELGTCEHLRGRPDVADPVFEAMVPRTRTDLEFADLSALRASLYITAGRFADVVACCLGGLARLGVTLPADPAAQQAGFMAGLAEVVINLGGRAISELVDAPALTDPRLQRILALLSELTPAAYFTSLPLFCLAMVTHVNTSLRHGHTGDSAFGYVSHGFLLIAVFGQYAVGAEFGRLGLALDGRFHNPRLACQLRVIYAMGLHYTRPLRETLELDRTGYRLGFESGDLNYATYGCYKSIVTRLELGEELPAVAADLDQFLRISTRAREVTSSMLMTGLRRMLADLQGEAVEGRGLDAPGFDEAIAPPVLCRRLLFRAIAHYLHGEIAGALAAGERAEQLLPGIAGLYESTLHAFYFGLTLVAAARAGGESDRRAHAGRIARCQASLDQWATSCPANYAHRAALLRAEAADLAGEPGTEELYRVALATAAAGEFVPDLALASVLAARHDLAHGRRDAARTRLLAARRIHARRGATALVADLDERHRDLLFPEAPPPERYIREAEPVQTRAAESSFDTLTVLRAAQTLAEELVLPRLIEQLMRTVLAHAGAQRGALILEQGGALRIAAVITHDPDVVQQDLHEPVDGSERLASSLVHYVARTRETVVLGDASRAVRFAGDRYITRHSPRSLLCLALTHQSRLLGVLYLENNLAPDVFTAEQVDLVRMLSSHAAISVQNALLYANVERMAADLRTSLSELAGVNQRLQDELAERERAEREHRRLQDEVIQVQSVRLAELGAPLIPITDKIMVMPIIGSLDRDRAARVVEAALTGAHRARAAVVILDVTGLPDVDAGAVASLLHTARALRLLGTAVVVTGVGPEVAREVVGPGLDRAAMVVRGTLESGIAYAIDRVGGGDPGRRN